MTPMTLAIISIIVTILFGCFTVVVTLLGCTWKVGRMFAKIDAEMSANREVMMAMNRRIERLESKFP